MFARGETGSVLQERRQYPRLTPAEDITVTMPIVINTQLLDISGSGALLSTSAELRPGQRARLRMLLGGEPFNAWFEVRHVAAGTMTGGEHRFHVGASFTSLDDASHRVLQKFLREDTRPG